MSCKFNKAGEITINRKITILTAGIALLLIFSVFSYSQNSADTVYDETADPARFDMNPYFVMEDDASVNLRVGHFAALASATVDILVNESIQFANVAYKDVGGYISLSSGFYNITVAANSDGSRVLQQNFTLAAGSDYTVLALSPTNDTAVLAGDAGPLYLQSYVDDVSTNSGVRYNIYHVTRDAGEIFLNITTVDSSFSSLISGVNYQDRITTLLNGTDIYNVDVINGSDITESFGNDDLSYAAGNTISVFFGANVTTAAFTPVVDRSPTGAQLRLAHLIPDAPAVDIHHNITSFADNPIENVTYGAFTSYVAGDSAPIYNISSVVTSYTGDVIATNQTFSVPTDQDTTVALTGTSDAPVAVTVPSPVTASNQGQTRLRVANLAANAPNVDVSLGGADLASDLNFTLVSSYSLVSIGADDLLTLEVRDAASGNLEVNMLNVTLTPGATYTVYLNGYFSEAPVTTLTDTFTQTSVISDTITSEDTITQISTVTQAPVTVTVENTVTEDADTEESPGFMLAGALVALTAGMIAIRRFRR